MCIRNLQFQLFTVFFLSIVFSSYSQEIGDDEIVIKLKKEISNNSFGLLDQEKVNARLLSLGIKKARKIVHKEANLSIQNAKRKLVSESKQRVDLIYKVSVKKIEKEKILNLLKAQSWIEYAEPIHQYEFLFTPNDTYQAFHWGHTNTQTYEA